MALRGTAQVINSGGGSGTTAVITVSGIGIQLGDLILLTMNGGNGGGTATFTFPAGFVRPKGLAAQALAGIDTSNFDVAYKFATATEVSASTLTITSTNTDFQDAQCRVYSGRNQSNPFTAVATTSNTSGTAASATLAMTGLTAALGDDIVVLIGVTSDSGSPTGSMTVAPPANYANGLAGGLTVTFDNGVASFDRVNAPQGATGTIGGTLTFPESFNYGYGGYVLALAAAPSWPAATSAPGRIGPKRVVPAFQQGVPAAPQPGYQFVQDCSAAGGTAPRIIVNQGDALLIAVDVFGGNSNQVTLSGNNNQYKFAGSGQPGGGSIQYFYALNCNAGPTAVVGAPNGNTIAAIYVAEYSGIFGGFLGFGAGDQNGPGSGANAVTTSQQVINTPTGAGVLAWGLALDVSGATGAAYSPGTGFTPRNPVWPSLGSGGKTPVGFPQDRRLVVNGSYAGTWTANAAAGSDVIVTGVIFLGEVPQYWSSLGSAPGRIGPTRTFPRQPWNTPPPPPVLQTPFCAVLDVANFFLEENPSTASSFTTTNSLTVAPGDNFLAVIVSPFSSLTFTLVSVSWNGIPLTFYARGVNPPIYQDGEIWYLPNPPPGTGTLTIVATAALGGFSYVVGFPCSGVDLTRPFGTFATKPINASNAYPVSLSVPGVGPADIAIAWSDGNVNKLCATGGQIELGQHNGGSAGYFPAGIFNPGSTAIFQWAMAPGTTGTNNNNINTGVVIRGGATWSGSPPTAPMRSFGGPRFEFPSFVQGLPPSGGGPVTNFLTLSGSQASAASFGPAQIGAIRLVTQAESLILVKGVTSSQPGTATQASVAAISKAIAHLFGVVTQATSPSMGAKNVGVLRTITQAESLTMQRAVTKTFATVTQASVATLVKAVSHLFAVVSQATTATLAKMVGKILTVTQATVATLLSIKVHLLTLSASVASTATLVKAIGAIRSVTQATSPAFKRMTGWIRSCTQTSTASLIKQVGKFLTLAQATVATLTHSFLRFVALSASQATSATLVKMAETVKSASQATSGTMKRSAGWVRNASTSCTAVISNRAVAVTKAISQASLATLIPGQFHHLVLTAVQATSAVLFKRALLSRVANAVLTVASLAAQKFTGVLHPADHIFIAFEDAIVRVSLAEGSARVDLQDGTVRLSGIDGSARVSYVEGRARVDLVDGAVRVVGSDGSVRVVLSDGAVITIDEGETE